MGNCNGASSKEWVHFYCDNTASKGFIFDHAVSSLNKDLGTSDYKWANFYTSGNIIKGSNTLTIPSKTGTLAVTSDTVAGANCIASTGYGDGTLTYYQTSGAFNNSDGWHHYIIANHGNGQTYYNFMLRLPF